MLLPLRDKCLNLTTFAPGIVASSGRTRSPIPGINTDALLNACKCIVSAEPVGTNAKTLAAIAEAARLHSFVSATCPNTPGNPISKQFKDPSSFCAFFNSYERHDSPIPNLNVPAIVLHQNFFREDIKHQSFVQQGFIDKSVIEWESREEIIFSEISIRQNVVEQDKHALKQEDFLHDFEHQRYCLIDIQLKEFLRIIGVHSKHLFNISFCCDMYIFRIFDAVKISNIFFIFDFQPYGSVWANASNQYKLYCNNYDIEGAEMYDYWIGMWGSIKQCDARAACTGIKCHGDYCMIYYGPLKLVPASSGSVALRIMPDAYEMITSNHLEAFCTTYLGYTTPFITETTTFFANATRTAVFSLTATSTIAALTTKTDFVETFIVTSTINASTITAPSKKRALETPLELDFYSETEISSTKDVPTTTTAVAYKNITSVVTEVATSTTTVLVNATSSTSSSATCTPTPKVDAEQQAKDLSALDFLFSHNNLTSMLSTFPAYILNQSSITGDVLPPIQSALQNWVPCTATSYNVTDQLLACKDTTNPSTFASCIIFRTDPYAIKGWKNNPVVPTFALMKARTSYRDTNVGIDGVPISLNMSLIEVMDHATEGGHYQAPTFKTMQYYFAEPGGHLY
ncbi:hypothetical protein KCU65_g7513, partial [Aureobasidium melanogenum]